MLPPVFDSFDRYSARMNLSFFTYATPSVLEGGERSPTIAEALCFFDSLERTVHFLLSEGLICEEMLCPDCDEPMNVRREVREDRRAVLPQVQLRVLLEQVSAGSQKGRMGGQKIACKGDKKEKERDYSVYKHV